MTSPSSRPVAPFKQVLMKTVEGPFRTGALTAFIVATFPFQVAGMPMAFWGLVAGIVVTMLGAGKTVRYWQLARVMVTSS